MTEDEYKETYNLKDYQPIQANPRKKFKRPSGGVAFYIKTGIDYELIKSDTNIEQSELPRERSKKILRTLTGLKHIDSPTFLLHSKICFVT